MAWAATVRNSVGWNLYARFGVMLRLARQLRWAARLIFVAVALGVTTAAAGTPTSFAAPPDWTGNGPYGGVVWDLAVHPTSPDVMLAATQQGIFRTSDGGQNWQPASRGLVRINMWNVAFNLADPSVAYASGSQYAYRSTDSGRTWEVSGRGVSVLEARPSSVYTTDGERLLHSSDQGQSWSTLYSGTGDIARYAAAPSDPERWYVAEHTDNLDEMRLFSSQDGGGTWSPLGKVATGRLLVDPENPGTLLLGNYRELRRSTDGGATWTVIFSREQTEYGDLGAFAFAPAAPHRIFLATQRGNGPGMVLFSSNDGGDSWSASPPILGGNLASAIRFRHDDPSQIYLADWHGVWHSVDHGLTFVPRITGITAAAARAIAVDANTPQVVYASLWNSGVFRSDDGGGTWVSVTAGLAVAMSPIGIPVVSSLVVDAGGSVYATVGHDTYSPAADVYRSDDRGVTWLRVSVPSTYTDSLDPAKLIVAHPNMPGRLLATGGLGGEVFRTDTGGSQWNRVREFGNPVTALAHHPRSGLVYAASGSNREGVQHRPQMAVSGDFGRTWTAAALPGFTNISSFGIDPTSSRVYAGSHGSQIAASDDNGETWQTHWVDFSGAADDIRAIAVDPVDPTQVFVGTRWYGMWMSQDRGRSWAPSTPGATDRMVYALSFGAPYRGESAPLRARPLFAASSLRTRLGVVRGVPKPHNLRRPRATGRARVGEALFCTRGRWSRANRHEFKWLRDGNSVPRATAQTYRLRNADLRHKVSCVVSATGTGGTSRRRSGTRYVRD